MLRRVASCCLPLLSLCLFAPAYALAEDAADLANLSLSELADIPIVSAARHEQSRTGSPRAVSVLTAEEIRRRNYRNVPEALATLPGVFLQQTNYGGGSPIIRGMVGNRILIMVNGIRVNNATYRLGPNQYLNLIDINLVERIEVVRGAGSVLYGSDAFGGVINVITRKAPDPRMGTEHSASARVRFSSADAGGSGRVQVMTATGPLGLTAGFTQDSYGDLAIGGTGPNQSNVGYRQSAGDLSMTYALRQNATLSGGFTRLKQFDVPRTDVLNAGTDLEHHWSPQGRDLGWMEYTQNDLPWRLGSLQVTASWQRTFEQWRRIQASDRSTQRFHDDQVRTATLTAQVTTALGGAHVLTYGFDSGIDRVSSGRTDVSLMRGTSVRAAGTYADGSHFSSISGFLQDELILSNRLSAVVGLRYDRFALTADVRDTNSGHFPVRSTPDTWNGSAHLLYKLTPTISLIGGVAQGFRAPNIDDSTVLGVTGSRFEIPNAKLEPEKSLNVEYGVRVAAGKSTASITVFDANYRNLIDRAPATLNGLSFQDLNGNRIKDNKEVDVFQRQNISRAIIRGVEFQSMVPLNESWTWSHSTTWTRGNDTVVNRPLSRIPPLNGVSKLTWQSPRLLWVEGGILAASAQRRLSPGDISDIRIGPSGTSGYVIFNVRAGLRQSPLAGLSAAWENVTDRRYKLHGSGFYRPGANFILGFARNF